ncbi:hypothetical protein (mitochondrion) [Myxobolus squamalis]|uniref:NADH dehydrogenase subunit 2 n=1 Tax=Myxobolus squamalis TaxID=59785 RepID=A0A678XHY7_MYXSQ|nr:hypothetical protein [Myxobolus squamalis]
MKFLIIFLIYFLIPSNLSSYRILLLSLLLQLLLIIFIFRYSIIFIFISEVWIITSIFINNYETYKNSKYILIIFLISIPILFILVIFLQTYDELINLILTLILIKTLLMSLICFLENNKVINIEKINYMIFYVFNSKILIFIYSFIIYNMGISNQLNYLNNPIIIFFVLLSLIFLYVLIFICISRNDWIKYILILINISQLLMLTSGQINTRLFFISLLIDIIMPLILIYIILYGKNILTLIGSYIGLTSFLILIAISFTVGLIPFPSFFLEVSNLIIYLNFIKKGFEPIYIFILYLLLLIHFILLLKNIILIEGGLINIHLIYRSDDYTLIHIGLIIIIYIILSEFYLFNDLFI